MGSVTRWARLLAAPVVVACALAGAPAASATLPSLLASCESKDALDDNAGNGVTLPFAFCNDGLPDQGGATPNPGAVKAVAVPAAYTGPGQPVKHPTASLTVPGNSGGDIALDVDLSVPDPVRHPVPPTGYPLVVLMHGCCSGDKTGWEGRTIDPGGKENWHYNNAWFASRGYVVINYTARGFVNSDNRGSTGQTQLDSNRFEINDYQHLAGRLADVADLNPKTLEPETIDPERVVPTGGSYGGGFTWLALTDPTWLSPGGKAMKVVAAAPKFGWTNLVEALVPNGADRRDALPTFDPAKARAPLGFPKRTIVSALYASGKTGVPPGGPHTTFAPDIDAAFACLSSVDPFATNPLCLSTLATTLPRFISERSAYYQTGFFAGLANGTIDPVPVFSAGAFTDQLFPAAEHRRMVERLKLASPGYPVQEYYGDYNHFVQDKRKEWSDLCGADRHVCAYADYPGGDLNAEPSNLATRGRGVTTRLNRFIDRYANPQGNPGEPEPAFDVTGSLQVCPQNAGDLGVPADEAGPRFSAPTFAQLAPYRLTISAAGAQPTTNVAAPNQHARNSDPVANLATNGGRCPVETAPGGLASAGPGVATYDSAPLPSRYTMLGMTRVTVPHTGAGGDSLQLNARLYDLHPDGTQVLVDRGVKRLTTPNATTVLDLHGTGWRFEKGHRIRIELAQDDDPYIRASNVPSSLVLQGVRLSLPVREATASVGGEAARPPGAAPRISVRSPRLASDRSRTRRFPITIRRRAGTSRASVRAYRLQIRDTTVRRASAARRSVRISARRRGPKVFRFRGRPGHTYRIRARAVDGYGRAGPWDSSRTIVPFEVGRAKRGLRYGGRWKKRARVRGSYNGRLSRSSRRGATLRFRFRGTRLFIVGRTSRRGGKAIVKINRRVSVISFYGGRTRNRRVVGLFRTRRGRVNTATIVTLGRKGSRRGRGRRVEIDALGVRRP